MYTKRNLLDSQGFEDFVVLRSVISLPNQYNLQERTLSRLRRLWLITMKKIGIVGVGCISGIYLENITKRFRDIEIIGVCDLIRERAENAVKQYDIPKLYEDMHELFADPEVDIVLNITRPYEHYEVSRAALLAGKHVYSEKPLGASWEEGKALVELAKEKGLWIGGAPDTFLGAGIQTCRKLMSTVLNKKILAMSKRINKVHTFNASAASLSYVRSVSLTVLASDLIKGNKHAGLSVSFCNSRSNYTYYAVMP